MKHLRSDGRASDELRPVKIVPGYLFHPTGSCLIELGRTRVVCSAMVEESVPEFLKGTGKGWLTAEYSMLPGSSGQRVRRERQKLGGRTHEIQRLIGRSLRAAIDLNALGERSLLVDCDVIDADGGTRTASITGGYVALAIALARLRQRPQVALPQIRLTPVAAISVGVIQGTPCLDLHYDDDRIAGVDMNIVKTAAGDFVEIQGTAEGKPFSWSEFESLTQLASRGIAQLFRAQQEAIELAMRAAV